MSAQSVLANGGEIGGAEAGRRLRGPIAIKARMSPSVGTHSLPVFWLAAQFRQKVWESGTDNWVPKYVWVSGSSQGIT